MPLDVVVVMDPIAHIKIAKDMAPDWEDEIL